MDKTDQSSAAVTKARLEQPTLNDELVEGFPVSAIMESRPSISSWLATSWRIIGIVVGWRESPDDGKPVAVNANGEVTRYLCNGLRVALYKDECESYYYNLISPKPRCYVVAHVENYDQPPDPFLVTLSFDEAHAYLEGEDDIYDVDVPAELYRWVEAFVLAHYAPEKRIKRKRKDWKVQERPS